MVIILSIIGYIFVGVTVLAIFKRLGLAEGDFDDDFILTMSILTIVLWPIAILLALLQKWYNMIVDYNSDEDDSDVEKIISDACKKK